jgi:hypothetical protein
MHRGLSLAVHGYGTAAANGGSRGPKTAGDRQLGEAVQDGRIFIELINYPMLFKHRATPAGYKAGPDLAIERGWLWKHDSGTCEIHPAGAELFA